MNAVAERLNEQIAKQRAAIEMLVRLHREFMACRGRLDVDKAVEHLDMLLGANATMIQELKEDLAISLLLRRGAHVEPAAHTAQSH